MKNVTLTHDAGVSAFGDASGDNATPSFDEEHVVTVDAPADLEGAFDTNQFYKIEAVTIARPIEQRYVVDGESRTYVKPADELRQAAWSFDNKPFTLGHPNSGMVRNVDDIHGFWRNPRYDDTDESLKEDLYIPVEDDEALSFIEDNRDVSVGFYNRVASDYDGDVGDLVESDPDGYQVQMYGNHIAGVEHGRCSSSHGCGLDDAPHGTVYSNPSESGVTPFVGSVDEMDLSVPESAQSDAQAFLDAVDDGKVPDSCGGPDGTGRRRAGMLAEGGDLSLETWVTGGTDAIANWHPRHEGNEDYDESEVDTPWEDCGYAMFKAWGGESARNKAARLKEQYEMSQDHGFIIDASQGDWVEWDASGGTAYGKVDNMVRDGCTSRGKGDMEVCAEDDDPVAEVEVYDDETGESKDEIVRHKESELRSWSGPTNDNSTSFQTQKGSTDAPSGLYEGEDGWYGIAPSETADDEPKYELDNCNDVKDAWNLRGSGDYEVEQSTLETRIKRAADAHNCPPEQKPWVDENMDDFDIPDLTVDALAEQNDAVATLKAERDELSETIDEMEQEIREAFDGTENVTIEADDDECVCDAVEDIVADFDAAAARVEKLNDELEEYREEERQEALDTLEDLGADRDEWEDEGLDAIEEEVDRREEVLESVDSTTVKNVDSGGDGGDDDADKTFGRRTFGRGHGA